jgi:NAD(P)-dependent dehydrogenase (short-subunit alcohol dehydrogenase family)
MMVVNAIGPYVLARSLLGSLAATQGKAIAISSDMGSIAANRSGGYVPYRSSKSALNSAWRSLAIEARPHGIIVAAFNPGWVKTRMGGPNATLPPEQSIGQMRALIAGLTASQSGGFFERDGRIIAW